MTNDERSMLHTFVELADSLARDFDVSEFLELLLDRCVEIFHVTTAGVMLESPEGCSGSPPG